MCTDKGSMACHTVMTSRDELSILGLDLHSFYVFIFYVYLLLLGSFSMRNNVERELTSL